MMWSLGAGCATDGLDPVNNGGGDGDSGLRERDASGGGGGSDVSSPDLGGGGDDAGGVGEDAGGQDAGGVDAGGGDDAGTEDAGGDDAGASDAGVDSGMEDAGDPDMGQMDPTCADVITLDRTYDLGTATPVPQLSSRVVFDGESIWVVYTRREMTGVGDGDVYAARYACDGAVINAPFKVSEGTGINDANPQIAVGGETVWIVWTANVNGDQKIFARAYDRGGQPRSASPIDVVPQIGGQPISTLVWEPDVAVLSETEAVLVASYASPTAGNAFQVLVQRLDPTGSLIGDALEAYDEKDVDQTRPTVTSAPDGSFHVAYTRDDKTDPNDLPRVYLTRFAPGATESDPGGPIRVDPGPVDNQIARYAKERLPNGETYLVAQRDSTGDNDLIVRDGRYGGSATLGLTAAGPTVNLRPSIAARPGGGAIAWYRAAPSPVAGDVYVSGFENNGGAFLMGTPFQIPTSNPGRPPYGPGIAHVGDGIYFVTWSEGTSIGSATLKGRFVQP
jgi:hypothetical protein